MLLTKRLRLREWQDRDIPNFAKQNADPRVMQHFPATMTTEETAAAVKRYRASFAEHGLCFFAVDRLDTGAFIGTIGLGISTWDKPFLRFIEVGWRLTPSAWGHGFATEGALASLALAFSKGFEEVLAITPPINKASQAVMRRLGMHRDPKDDFDHPKIADGHALKRNILHRIDREQFRDHVGDGQLFTLE